MINKSYKPIEAHNLLNVTEEEWLQMRTEGIGGSDAAKVLGISPWGTKYDLWHDKVGIDPLNDDKNSMILDAGHHLENFVAQLYGYLQNANAKGEESKKVKVFEKKIMYRHPLYPFMQGDIDRFVERDGNISILEIKTTSDNNKSEWFSDIGKPIIPKHYECQVRHYMAVTNIDEADICCLFCNEQFRVLASILSSDVSIPEDKFSKYAEEYFIPNLVVRHITRDEKYEEKLIKAEKEFWETYVVPKIEPPFENGDGKKALKALERYTKAKESKINISTDISSSLQKVDLISAQIQSLKNTVKTLESNKSLEEAKIIKSLQNKDTGFFETENEGYEITYKKGKPSKRILAKDLKKFEAQYPDIASQFVSETNPTAKLKIKKWGK